MKKTVLFVSLMFVLLVSSSVNLFAHNTDQPHEETYTSKSTLDVILPFSYLEEKNYGSALLVVLFWFLLIKGGWDLVKLLIGRAM